MATMCHVGSANRALHLRAFRTSVSSLSGLVVQFAFALILIAYRAAAQEVGTVAEVEGTAEIGHGGAWHPATIGAAIQLHDELRTGQPGRLRVVFQDDSPLNIGDDSDIVVDEQVFDPGQSRYRSTLRLLKGKIRALVSEYYQQPQARYQIETVSAVSGVRGTEFVMVFDPAREVTEVVGITGRVEVHSVRDRKGHEVFVTEHELTTVQRGRFPTPPRLLDDAAFRQYVAGLEFIGHGQSESLTINHPLLSGRMVSPADRRDALVIHPPAGGILPHGQWQQRQSNAIIQPPDVLRAIRAGRGDLGINLGGGGQR